MENISPDQDEMSRRRTNGSVWTGVFMLGIGGVLLLDQLGVDFPWWMFKWYTLLIVLGLFIGAKHAFKDFGWLIVTGIGVIFLLQDTYKDLPVRDFAWPVMLIVVGLFIIFRPKKACFNKENFQKKKIYEPTTGETGKY